MQTNAEKRFVEKIQRVEIYFDKHKNDISIENFFWVLTISNLSTFYKLAVLQNKF